MIYTPSSSASTSICSAGRDQRIRSSPTPTSTKQCIAASLRPTSRPTRQLIASRLRVRDEDLGHFGISPLAYLFRRLLMLISATARYLPDRVGRYEHTACLNVPGMSACALPDLTLRCHSELWST